MSQIDIFIQPGVVMVQKLEYFVQYMYGPPCGNSLQQYRVNKAYVTNEKKNNSFPSCHTTPNERENVTLTSTSKFQRFRRFLRRLKYFLSVQFKQTVYVQLTCTSRFLCGFMTLAHVVQQYTM